MYGRVEFPNPVANFWSKLDENDMNNIKNNITFVTYDQVKSTPFLCNCSNGDEFYNLVKASTCHKLLFPCNGPLIDGKYVDFNYIQEDSKNIKKNKDSHEWLILELGDDVIYDDEHIVYRPEKYYKSVTATFNLNKKQIKDIIDSGKRDATHFYHKLLLM